MEKIVEQGLLYDFYGELLTGHQQEIYESVVYENLSLGEIAEAKGISRQAVHDIVKRCDKILLGYEEKLKLVERFTNIKEKIEQINRLSEQYENGELESPVSYGSQIRELSARIMQEL
ncbi:MAG: DNA-binding protein [Lachnospiraceae bacterium]|nr:DNA-binding protein [Lachnospiraceae bacterium]MCI9396145.1 DNA-binding protein [Lachnospiraceae bacterium]